MTSEALNRLCRCFGIETGYTDIWGQRHEVSAATARALLAAMGVDAGDDRRASEAYEAWERARWSRMLESVAVLHPQRGRRSISVRLTRAEREAGLAWVLDEEGGARRTGRVGPGDLEEWALRDQDGETLCACRFELEEPPDPGYHRLTVRSNEREATMLLIVAPAACYVPPALEAGRRVWGISAQLYALRSPRNWGIGDYADLATLVEIASEARADLVGVSPLHALFPHAPEHASPYSPSSRLLLNTLLIDVEGLPEFRRSEEAQRFASSDETLRRLEALKASELVDYAAIAGLKRPALEQAYAEFRRTSLARDDDRAQAFEAFRRDTGAVLRRHALFEALQDHFHAADSSVWGWPAWPEAYHDPEGEAVRAFEREKRERVEYFEYLQWAARDQLDRVADLSAERELEIGLYLDLAVGINPDGAESWQWQRLFARNARIGAPPDDFNLEGQDWGLPPMVPHRMRDEAYAGFIATLRQNMRSAGALRLDHVMGLRRLFWVPAGGSPKEGAYVRYPFEDLLGILALESQRASCLVVGEDLGTVPDEVREALEPMGVLSYRLLYFERHEAGRFRTASEYPGQALVAVTTHDLPTLRGFWHGDDLVLRDRLGLFPTEELRERLHRDRELDRPGLLALLEAEGLLPEGTAYEPAQMSHELVLALHLFLARTPSWVMVVQAEDLLDARDQPNLPGTEREHPNWRQRLPVDVGCWLADPRRRAFLRRVLEARSGGLPKR